MLACPELWHSLLVLSEKTFLNTILNMLFGFHHHLRMVKLVRKSSTMAVNMPSCPFICFQSSFYSCNGNSNIEECHKLPTCVSSIQARHCLESILLISLPIAKDLLLILPVYIHIYVSWRRKGGNMVPDKFH